MKSRVFAVGLALVTVAACDRSEATDPAVQASPASAAPASEASPAQTVLTEVWQSANPGVASPTVDVMSAAFDPTFAKIVNAPNDADNALIASTLAFIRAVENTSALCAEAPVARFELSDLAAMPQEALPAFRTMLTDRLALVAAGAANTAPLETLMSGSMQNFSAALGDSPALEILPEVASAPSYDLDRACPATIAAWEALDKSPQSPQLMKMLYSGEL